MVQAFILARYLLPGRHIRTPSDPAVHIHSLLAARKAYPDPGWSSRSSSLASAARKAYPDPEWSSRSSSLAIRRHEGVSGPRVVQPFIFTRHAPPGRSFRTVSGPAVYLHSPAIRRRDGASGPRVVQPFIFTRVPPPGRRIRTARGPAVHLLRYPPSGRRIRTARGQLFFLTHCIRRPHGAFGSRMVLPFASARLSAAREQYPFRICVQPFVVSRPSAARNSYSDHAGVPAVHLTHLSAVRGVPGPREGQPLISTRLSAPKGSHRPQPFMLRLLRPCQAANLDRD